ncbi:peptide-methionine (R)-S-oxide reductase [Pontibacter chinhatensis]|uniref:peptide-methionine (R)-S-oxide reductase n=1 Tax=Pontibacter chinhatensis TaxID=1436961 RepID=A0A1I2TTE9_9BACT|nr:peptide-methionine (R)-S-oxide reductase [Pontibacter chinhatensis]SFG68215.1 peptide-methionine (R)-S-oxide reductase [Pontibacter chinhatensis]
MFRHRGKVREAQQEQDVYTCSGCGQVLFRAKYKFEVGSGFPSFWQQVGENVAHCPLDTYGRQRVQLLCSRCRQHLGHLFDDSRTPTGVRYCINATSITLDLEQPT